VAKNYYVILGINSDATPNQIKSAYRQKAKSAHPDCSGGSCEPFYDVQQAYEVLSDPARRKKYDGEIDRQRRERQRSWNLEPEPLIPTEQHTGRRIVQDPFYDRQFHTIHQDQFDHLWHDSVSRPGPRSGREQDIHVQINWTWEQSRRGGQVRMLLPLYALCPACQGQGESWFFPCSHCRGHGVIRRTYPLSITLPAGVSDGTIARLPLDQLGLYDTVLVAHIRVIR
jgi:molecular chaperone DnaJ